MSYTKRFKSRAIGLTLENKELLVLWSNHQKKHVTGETKPIFTYEVANEKPIPTVAEALNRLVENCIGLGIGDCGLYMDIDQLDVDLDSHAHKFLLDFEKDLIKIGKQLSLSPNIDKDKIKNGALLQNEYALLKECLLRTLAKALEKIGAVNNSSEKYFSVLKDMVADLNNLSLSQTNTILEFFGKESSNLILELGKSLGSWIRKAEPIINAVHELNKTQTIIKNNINFLSASKLKLLQHLHYRLKKTDGENVSQTEYLEANTFVGIEEWEQNIIKENFELVPSLSCDLLLMPIVDALNSGDNAGCYVLDEEQLYYIKANNTEERVSIRNKDLLLKGIKEIKKTTLRLVDGGTNTVLPATSSADLAICQKDEISTLNTQNILYLTADQAKTLITLNGGHTNAFDKMSLEKRADIIYSLLRNKNVFKKVLFSLDKNLPWIKKIYDALIEIESVIGKLDNIDNLTSMLGYFFFLFNLFDGAKINKAINAVKAQADYACSDPELKGTELMTLGLSDFQVQETINPNFDFSSLNGTEYKKKGCSIVFFNLRQLLLTNNKKNNMSEFINVSKLRELINALFRGKFIEAEHSYTVEELMDIQPLISTQTLGMQTQNEVRKNIQSNSIDIIEDNGAYYKIKSDRAFSLNKDSIFTALRIQRNKVVQLLLENIPRHRQLREIASIEAVDYFKNRMLPVWWDSILVNNKKLLEFYHNNYLNIKIRQTSLITLCKLLRDLLSNDNRYVDCLSSNDADLVEYIEKTTPKLFENETVKVAYNEYLNNTKIAHETLKNIFSNEKLISAYIYYRYIDEKEGFVYKPNQINLTSSLLTLIELPIQIWAETEAGQYKKLESFNLSQNKTAINDLLFLNTHTNIGFTAFQRFERTHIIHTQDKTTLKQLLLHVMSEDCPLTTDQKKSMLNYFCVKNESVANMGLNAALANLELTIKQLAKFDRKLNLHETLIKEGEQYVVGRIAEMLSQMTHEQVNSPITDTFIDQITAIIKKEVIEYYSQRIITSYETWRIHYENQGLNTLLQWKGAEYWVASLPAKVNVFGQRDCRLYKKPPRNIYFASDPNNTHNVFEETIVKGDGECGLVSLKIKRNELVKGLKEAIQHPDNRKILALEIYNYLATMHTETEKNWNRNFITKEVELNFNKKYELFEKIDLIMNYFKSELDLSFPNHQACLDHINNNPNQKILYKNKINELQDLVTQENECEKTLLKICSELAFCTNYVKKYKENGFWLGKYAAKLYAKHKDITLYIYNKDVCKVPFVLGWDPETSYTSVKNPALPPMRIVFEHGSHFNILTLNTTIENPNPQKLWNEYATSLEKELVTRLTSYLPVCNTSLDEYKQHMIQVSKNPILLDNTLSLFDQETIKDCLIEVERAKELIALKEAREHTLKEWDSNSQSQIANYIQTIFAKYKITDYKLEDMAILANEYLDDKNQTLLLKAVKQKNAVLVECLLDLGASVVRVSDTDFELRINPSRPLGKINPNTYLLIMHKETPKVVYYDDKEDKYLIDIQEFGELKSLLLQKDTTEIGSEEFHTTVKTIINERHQLLHGTTPLLEAAKDAKTIAQEDSLFSTLIKYGLDEAKPRTLEVISAYTLKNISEQLFSFTLKNHLEAYLTDRQNTVKEYPMWAKMSTAVLQLINNDRTEERAIQFAKLLQILIEGEITRDYRFAADRCEKIAKEAEEKDNSLLIKDNSVLLNGTKMIAENTVIYIKENNIIHNAHYHMYLESKRKKTNVDDREKRWVEASREDKTAYLNRLCDYQIKLDYADKINREKEVQLTKNDSIKKELEEKNATIENLLLQHRKDAAILLHAAKVIKEHEEEHQKLNQNKASHPSDISVKKPVIQSTIVNPEDPYKVYPSAKKLAVESSEDIPVTKQGIQTKMKNSTEEENTQSTVNIPTITNRLEVSVVCDSVEIAPLLRSSPVEIKQVISNQPPQKSNSYASLPNFFRGGSMSLSLTSSFVNNPVLEEQIKKWLLNNDWSLNTLPSGMDNFFGALAIEINRIKEMEMGDLFNEDNNYSEKDLREFCSAFYKKNMRMVKELNQSLAKNSRIGFDHNRLANYSCIKYDQSTVEMQALEVPVILGLGAIEGIILCKDLNLPGIYIISTGIDNNFQYAKADNAGYYTDISEDEVKKNIETCPVLLKIGRSYHCITGPFIKNLTQVETEVPNDYEVTSDNDIVNSSDNDSNHYEINTVSFSVNFNS